MPSLALYAILLLLLAIAIELALLLRRISGLGASLASAADKKDRQTINVNVATTPLPDGGITKKLAKDAELETLPEIPEHESEVEEEPAPEAPPEPPPPEPRPVYVPGAKVSTSGQMIVKCPQCQAENSSYRDECFSCGTRLR